MGEQTKPDSGSLGYAWYVIAVLFVAYTFSFIDRQILALLVGPVKADLELTDFQFSLLHGLAFGIFYTLMGIPLGRLADSSNRRNLIAAGVALWSLMTALCGFAKNFTQLFLARIGVGVGEAALSPAAYSLIADYFPKDKLGRALGTYSSGVFIGAGLAYVVGGLVIQALANTPEVTVPIVGSMRSWQLTFLIVGLPGLLVALLVFTIREPLRKGIGAQEGAVPLAKVVQFLKERRRVFLSHFVGFALLALVFNAVASWAPAYFMRRFDAEVGTFGVQFGLIIGIFGGVGIVAGGVISDWLARRGYLDAPMRAGAWGAALLTPFAIGATIVPNESVGMILLCPLMFFASFPFGVAAVAMQIITPNRMRAQVSALYLFFVNLLGIALASSITAALTDYVFKDESMVGYSIAITAGLSAPLAALILASALGPYRQAARDIG